MAYEYPAQRSRIVPATIAVVGVAAATAGLAAGPKEAVAGGIACVLLLAIAVREARTPVVTWPNAIAALILVVWFIPIKLYSLPIDLGFNLEIYRVVLVALVAAWIIWAVSPDGVVTTAGHGKPLLLLGTVALASQIVNTRTFEAAGLGDEVLKDLSYFFSFLVVYVLVCSTLQSLAQAMRLVAALVAGGAIVGAVAIHESRNGYNLFDHLADWIPILELQPREVIEMRGGAVRVRSSSQHPIALGCALTMLVPLAALLARQAATNLRRIAWVVAGLLCVVAAVATISRTTVVMVMVMAVFALILRPRQVARYWPVVIILPIMIHFLAPGSLGGLWKSFFPQEGLVGSVGDRAGESGSGRLADFGPGLELWSQQPVVGSGLGSLAVTGQSVVIGPRFVDAEVADDKSGIIFDNQYLNTLVTLGILGLVGLVWFTWGAALKLARSAWARAGPSADLMAATSIAAAGFAASMFFFDAFSFVQTTIVFFVIAAIGLRVRALTKVEEDARSHRFLHAEGMRT
jgi:hypothetical protein